jgi:hypothetical protein
MSNVVDIVETAVVVTAVEELVVVDGSLGANITINGVASPPTKVPFITPTKTWIINHNLGYEPQVTILDLLGNKVYAATKASSTQIIVDFEAPAVGSILYR